MFHPSRCVGFARTPAHAMILLNLSPHKRTGADIMKPDIDKIPRHNRSLGYDM